jgi:hypothetical protein
MESDQHVEILGSKFIEFSTQWTLGFDLWSLKVLLILLMCEGRMGKAIARNVDGRLSSSREKLMQKRVGPFFHAPSHMQLSSTGIDACRVNWMLVDWKLSVLCVGSSTLLWLLGFFSLWESWPVISG